LSKDKIIGKARTNISLTWSRKPSNTQLILIPQNQIKEKCSFLMMLLRIVIKDVKLYHATSMNKFLNVLLMMTELFQILKDLKLYPIMIRFTKEKSKTIVIRVAQISNVIVLLIVCSMNKSHHM
jgi:hypothetical protein